MSRRTSIVSALVDKINLIDGQQPYHINLFSNAHAKLKFWDEINQFPAVYATPGSESREYLPGNLIWAYLGVSIKIYTKGEKSKEDLEFLLEDIEKVINSNRVLTYDTDLGYQTTEILVISVTTDEGLLMPYSVGEINLQIRYQLV
jgi:hypothetical protein